MIRFCQYLTSLLPSLIIINPLRLNSLTAISRFFSYLGKNPPKSTLINVSQRTDFSKTQHVNKVPVMQGIRNIQAFNGFNSFFHFFRQTFFHNRYILITNKTTKKTKEIVYNLSISDDESYVTELGITHNCRCNVVQVLKEDYPKSDSATAMQAGATATTKIGKDGKNSLSIFRFNPGKDKIIFPPKHPYMKANANSKSVNEQDKAKAKGIVEKLAEEKRKQQQWKQIRKYKNGGSIQVHQNVDRKQKDYKRLILIANHFAATGKQVELLPKVHHKDPMYTELYAGLIGTKYERKCPDLKIGEKYYEHEGYVKKRNSLKHMLTRGLKQSSRVIIEDEGSANWYVKKIVKRRVATGQNIEEVWILKGNNQLHQLY